MKPIVSVIIPVYNAEKYLADCLNSVLSQTLRELEIICVDDGSIDSSPEILADYASRDERIRVITQPNCGELAARYSGIRVAEGEWLGFVDSDDSITPDMIEQLHSNGVQNKADISHCGMMFCYPDGRKVPHYGSGIKKIQDHNTGLLDLLDGSQIEPSMCCKLYRRELFNDFSISSRIEHNGDMFCNFFLFRKASVSFYEDFCGYLYRQRTLSELQNGDIIGSLRGILAVRKQIMEMSDGEVRSAAHRLWLSTVVNSLNQAAVCNDTKAADFYEEYRNILMDEKDALTLLSRKQQIAANLHLGAPHTAKLVYSVYGKYSRYRYEH